MKTLRQIPLVTKRWVACGGAGIAAIKPREAPMPQPKPGEVLLRMTAATLNHRDLLFAQGKLPGLTKEPDYVPLSCATGEVAALGEGVQRVTLGDRVSPTFYQGAAASDQAGSAAMLGGSADGVATGWGTFPADSVVRVPNELSDLEAATLPCAGLTAWRALFGPRPLQAGETVVLQGTGGVSVAALQLAKAAGARVLITSSSDAKLRRAKALGADICINYRQSPDWADAALQQLGGANVDIVVDVAGASQARASASLLNTGGIIAAVGMLDGNFSWGEDVGKPIARITVGSRDEHEALLAFAAAHGIRPIVDDVYTFDELQKAFRHLESGNFFGKIGILM
ncbi:MAG: NAD(P)-dependent alcohol dehydrogenase [Sphingomicrobium sp.]